MIRLAARLALLGLTAGLALPCAALAQEAHAPAGTPATEAGEGHAAAGGHDEEKLDPIHHSADGFYMDFEPAAKVELPRLFVVRRADGSFGFDSFGSTAAALRSGRYVADAQHGAEAPEAAAHDTAEDSVLALMAPGMTGAPATPAQAEATTGAAHGSADAEALIASGAHLDAHLVPAEGALVLDLSLTRHTVFMMLGALLLGILGFRMAARYRKGPGRTSAPKGLLQNTFESLVLFVRDDIARPNIGAKADRFVPYLLTAFFFILILNYLGLVPWGATATSNIAVTTILAVFTFIATQLFASKDHWKHVFWPPGVPTFVKPILIPVEIMGLFTKPFALAIRLFANMTAGHLVILSLIGLIFTFNGLFGSVAGWGVAPVSVAFSLFIYLLELLVSFLQAYVFTMLSAIFIGMAVASHDHADHHVDHGDGHGDQHEHSTAEKFERDGDLALTV
jgi:F-type H+-transporting ATPase subunit a